MSRNVMIAAAFVSVHFLFAPVLFADDSCTTLPHGKNVLIVDMSDGKKAKVHKLFPIDCSTAQKTLCDTWATIGTADPKQRNYKSLLPDLGPEVAETQQRWLATKGERFSLVLLYAEGVTPVSQIVEEKRATRLADDFSKLFQLIEKGLLAGVEPRILAHCSPEYVLTEKRAIVTVRVGPIAADKTGAASSHEAKATTGTAQAEAAVGGSAQHNDGDAGGDASLVQAQGAKSPDPEMVDALKLVTGPVEHWYISADVPVNSAKALEFDQTANTLVLKEQPQEILIGLNYTLGDLWGNERLWDIKKVGFKALVELDSEPLDTVGAALSYPFGPMSVFAGYLWIKEDKQIGQTSGGNPVVDDEAQYRGDWRVGLGFNLNQALEWLKKDDSNKKK